jgi:hydrogenase small subunit
MADGVLDQAGESEAPQPIREIDVLWLTAGLSCDGDTIAMTAATQPSIDDLVLGAIPGIPNVRLQIGRAHV